MLSFLSLGQQTGQIKVKKIKYMFVYIQKGKYFN